MGTLGSTCVLQELLPSGFVRRPQPTQAQRIPEVSSVRKDQCKYHDTTAHRTAAGFCLMLPERMIPRLTNNKTQDLPLIPK